MKLTIFGATGGTGQQLVKQSLEAGHEVTAVVRDPARLSVNDERLQVVCADVFDPAALEPAIAGRDAVLSVLGGSSYRTPTTIYSTSTRSILTAMHVTEVQRFIAVSASPVNPAASSASGDKLLYRLTGRRIIRAIFKQSYADMARMEDVLRQSSVNWTVMRPPRLTDKLHTGRYRTCLNRNVPGGYFISRADLADAMLRLIADPATFKAFVGIGY